MPKIRNRLIIDTNLWISFLLTRDFTKLERIVAGDNATLIFSKELLDEFIEVARRPKFKKYFSIADLELLLKEIHLYAEFIEVTSIVDICRDPKDNFLLSLAIDSKASYLLSGDKDLLELKKMGKTKIVLIREYLERL